MLRVVHSGGETTYESDAFRIDDASAVLLVFADPACKRTVAAYNREVWGYVEFLASEDGEPDGDTD